MSSTLEGFGEEIELQDIGPNFDNQPGKQIFEALNAVPKPFNLLQSLRKLTQLGITALTTYRPIIQQFFTPGVGIAIVAPVAIALIANSDYIGSSNPSEPGNKNQTYLLTTYTNTPQIVFKFFILQLPDQGNGVQIVYPNVPWQEYRKYFTLHLELSIVAGHRCEAPKPVLALTFVHII